MDSVKPREMLLRRKSVAIILKQKKGPEESGENRREPG